MDLIASRLDWEMLPVALAVTFCPDSTSLSWPKALNLVFRCLMNVVRPEAFSWRAGRRSNPCGKLGNSVTPEMKIRGRSCCLMCSPIVFNSNWIIVPCLSEIGVNQWILCTNVLCHKPQTYFLFVYFYMNITANICRLKRANVHFVQETQVNRSQVGSLLAFYIEAARCH